MKADYLEMDSLAAGVGQANGVGDQALKAVLSRMIGEQDKDLWVLLPYMYAASFVSSKTCAEAVFHPTIEGMKKILSLLSVPNSCVMLKK